MHVGRAFETGEGTNETYPVLVHQSGRQVDPRRAIMVAAKDHYPQGRATLRGSSDKAVEPPHRRDGRVRHVIDIARDHQRIGVLRLELIQQPGKKCIMFRIAGMAM